MRGHRDRIGANALGQRSGACGLGMVACVAVGFVAGSVRAVAATGEVGVGDVGATSAVMVAASAGLASAGTGGPIGSGDIATAVSGGETVVFAGALKVAAEGGMGARVGEPTPPVPLVASSRSAACSTSASAAM